jgi:16S rRNA (guanine966-N2)-methyltransferase
MLRILGGEFRSRVIQSPEGDQTTRPMASRAKEAIFNLLRGWFDGTNVLDLFAGVGTMGLEAVSRGAKRVVMVEMSRTSHRILEENIAALKCADRAEAIRGDALSPLVLARAPKPVSVMFIDPPYRMMENERERAMVFAQIQACRAVLTEKSFVVLRTPDLEESVSLAIPGFEGPETHSYGADMRVHLYMPVRKAATSAIVMTDGAESADESRSQSIPAAETRSLE